MDKKTIKINFAGCWNSFSKNNNMFTILLSRHFNVEISENPDFVICFNRGDPFEYMKYNCVRIMYMVENISPDFTVFDYCIGFDFMEFGDRYFRLPFAFYTDNAVPWVPQKLSREKAKKILNNKKYFCNFIYGHQSSHGMREQLYYKLNEYKSVVSPGSYLNNINGSKKRCSWKEKHEYVAQSKFTIAGDSIHYPGFVTEKIIDSYIGNSIPIYYGSTRIYDDFNRNSFVCCENEKDLNSVIEQVKYLDNNDDAYIEMLIQQPLVTENYTIKLYEQLELFLVNIFTQDVNNAYRRVRDFCAGYHEKYLREYMRYYKRQPEIVRKVMAKISKGN